MKRLSILERALVFTNCFALRVIVSEQFSYHSSDAIAFPLQKSRAVAQTLDGPVFLIEGGQFQWPPVSVGFKQNVLLQMLLFDCLGRGRASERKEGREGPTSGEVIWLMLMKKADTN